jgi:hypothetical protein
VNAPGSARAGERGLVRSIVTFTLVQAVLVIGLALVLSRTVWSAPDAASAVWASAWLAIVVQTMTFAVARMVARENVIAGWGLGVVLRFATVGAWALLGIKALELPSGPALLSLVVFYFVSTLVEPLFLNG